MTCLLNIWFYNIPWSTSYYVLMNFFRGPCSCFDKNISFRNTPLRPLPSIRTLLHLCGDSSTVVKFIVSAEPLFLTVLFSFLSYCSLNIPSNRISCNTILPNSVSFQRVLRWLKKKNKKISCSYEYYLPWLPNNSVWCPSIQNDTHS